MNITLQVTPEVERRLKEAAAGNGLTVEDYIRRVAEQSLSGSPTASATPYEEWQRQFRAWVASHKALPGPVDDDRDTIYAGRGE